MPVIEKIKARIDSIHPLTDTVLQVMLVPESFIAYQPGQYLQIICQDEAMSYSIANGPLGSGKYELHIRHSRDNAANQALLHDIKTKGSLTIQLPFGDCYLSRLEKEKSIVFIAAGTGFAPVKAMIEQLLMDADPRSFALFWLSRSQSDLYMDNMVATWQSHVKHFRYYPLISGDTIHKLADLFKKIHQANHAANQQWVISGPFDMVYSLRDMLVAQGISPGTIYADAFSFEQNGE